MATKFPIVYNTDGSDPMFKNMDVPTDVIDPLALPAATETVQGAVKLADITTIVQTIGAFGPAGGDLNGTYPNPNVNQGTKALMGKLKLLNYTQSPDGGFVEAQNDTDAVTIKTVADLLWMQAPPPGLNNLQKALQRTLSATTDFPIRVYSTALAHIFYTGPDVAETNTLSAIKHNVAKGGNIINASIAGFSGSPPTLATDLNFIKASASMGTALLCNSKVVCGVNSLIENSVRNAMGTTALRGETKALNTPLNIGVYGKATGEMTTYAGYFDGDAIVTGTLTATVVPPSDGRFKENLRSIDALANAMFTIPVYKFDWKEEGSLDIHQIKWWREEQAEIRAKANLETNELYQYLLSNLESLTNEQIIQMEEIELSVKAYEMSQIIENNELPPVTPRTDCIGVLAQDVEGIAPFMVEQGGLHYLNNEEVNIKIVRMTDFIGILLKQNQLLKGEITALKDRLLILEAAI